MARLQPVAGKRQFDNGRAPGIASKDHNGSREAIASTTTNGRSLMGLEITLFGKKVRVGQVLAVVAAIVTISGAAAGVFMEWGAGKQRIAQLEKKDEAHEVVIGKVQENLSDLRSDQAATRATVEAIKEQQKQDRQHFDGRLDRLFDEVRRNRQ